MGTSTALWDAARVLNDRIKTAAATATPAELAYLTKAMESLGGTVSLIDLAEHLENIKTELNSKVAESITTLENTLNSKLSATQNHIELISNQLDTTAALYEQRLLTHSQDYTEDMDAAAEVTKASVRQTSATEINVLNTKVAEVENKINAKIAESTLVEQSLQEQIALAGQAIVDLQNNMIGNDCKLFFMQSF